MIYNYYPGCTLSTKGQKLDRAARRAAEALGFPLVELPEWQCCGAVYPMAPDAIAERLSAVRALAAAKANGGVLVTLCSACHHVLKRVNNDMATKPEIAVSAAGGALSGRNASAALFRGFAGPHWLGRGCQTNHKASERAFGRRLLWLYAAQTGTSNGHG